MIMKKGLVLSGGGHRGVAHAGALQAMKEFELFPDEVSGSSAGAIVGAMYCAGYEPEDILSMFKEIKLFTFSTFARSKAGFVNSDVFRNYLIKYFPDNSFEKLERKLFVTATSLITGQKKVFSDGDLISSVLASAAVPGVFTPVEIDNDLYTDGGIIDNFPCKPLENRVDEMYGVYVCPLKEMNKNDFKRTIDVINRAVNLKMHDRSLKKFKYCKWVIAPQELESYHLFQASQADAIFEIGYREALKILKLQYS